MMLVGNNTEGGAGAHGHVAECKRALRLQALN